MKRINLLIVIYISIFCLLLANYAMIDEKSLNVAARIQIAIYPSRGGLSDTYYFVIDPDTGKMMVEYGTMSREEFDFERNHFMINGRRFLTYRVKQYLSSEEIEQLIDLLNKIYDDYNLYSYSDVADSWGIALYYNKMFMKNNSYGSSVNLDKLVNYLCDKSSMKVDLNGFS